MWYMIVVLLIGLAILIHELGHLLAAKMLGIPIARFSIGFGPALWRINRNGTEYRLALLPCGGYVLPEAKNASDFLAVAAWKRGVFAIAGPVANLLACVLLFAAINAIVDNTSLYRLLVLPFTQTSKAFISLWHVLPMIFAQPEAISGIGRVVADGTQIVAAGKIEAMTFLIIINLNLAVFNLLPLPPLDGGKILLNLLEIVHPRSRRLQVPLTLIGWAAIIIFAILINLRDILSLSAGGA